MCICVCVWIYYYVSQSIDFDCGRFWTTMTTTTGVSVDGKLVLRPMDSAEDHVDDVCLSNERPLRRDERDNRTLNERTVRSYIGFSYWRGAAYIYIGFVLLLLVIYFLALHFEINSMYSTPCT